MKIQKQEKINSLWSLDLRSTSYSAVRAVKIKVSKVINRPLRPQADHEVVKKLLVC